MSDINAIKITEPITITDSILIDSGSPPETNVPENDYAEWDSGTTYNEGDRVILTSTHRIYESLLGSNTGNDPTLLSSPAYWIEVGPTNRWAPFDTSVSTSVRQANNITYTLQPNSAINMLAVLNIVNGGDVTVTVNRPTQSPSEVYSKTISLSSAPLTSGWWSWFFGTRLQATQAIFDDIPPYSDGVFTIEITGGSDLSVGVILLGQQQLFGLGIKYGARVGIQDYSRKETNEFGETVLIKRTFAKRANVSLFLDKSEVDPLQNELSRIRATPCLWILSNEYESTTLFGFYKNFDILINYPEHADCDLEIEGLA
jgi:hypothetical protein